MIRKIFIIMIFVAALADSIPPPLRLDNPMEYRKALVALDKEKTAWYLFHYADPNTIHFAAKGKGTAAEVVRRLKDDQIHYVVLYEEGFGRYAGYVLVKWIGTRVSHEYKLNKEAHFSEAQFFLKVDRAMRIFSRDKFNVETIFHHPKRP